MERAQRSGRLSKKGGRMSTVTNENCSLRHCAPTHETSSDCFTLTVRKLAAATIGENVNNQIVQDPG